MNTVNHVIAAVLAGALLSVPVSAEQARSSRRAAKTRSVPAAAPIPSPVAANPGGAKTISYGLRDVVSLTTRVRFTTLVILPKGEEILDFVCGDKELWSIEGEQNFAYVKPSTEGTKTNLNLVTASGNVYSFILAEVSGIPGADPDLKVFVELKDAAMQNVVGTAKRLASARELDEAHRELERAKAETQQLKNGTAEAIDAGINHFVTNVRFAYRFEAGKRPFYVRAMYHDGRFTYIQARPEETPTLYEVKDRKPNLISFSYENGAYVVPKILDEGYLARIIHE